MARVVGSALAHTGIALSVNSILYGADDLVVAFRQTQRAVELHATFQAGRLLAQEEAAGWQSGDAYDGGQIERFRAAWLLEQLAYTAANRAYADGIEAVGSRPNLTTLLNFLQGEDWRAMADELRDLMAASEAELMAQTGHPVWLDSALELAAARIPPKPDLSDPSMVYNITDYVDLAEREIMRLGRGSIAQVAYSPDGISLAVAGSQGVSLYRLDQAAEVRLLSHPTQVLSVAYSPDGTRIVSGADDSTVRVWDAVSGEELAQLSGHAGSV